MMHESPATPRSNERQRMDGPHADKGHLPRLTRESYRGLAFVHWTLTTESRATGWLTGSFHHAWRHVLLHTCARYNLLVPVYTLMPDHAHVLLLGIDEQGSDQRAAIEFLRRHTRTSLAPVAWQRQAYDHVLRARHRERDAFQSTAYYILENPVRAELAPRWEDYAYVGCCIPGYPEFDVRSEDYWPRFWRCYAYLIAQCNS